MFILLLCAGYVHPPKVAFCLHLGMRTYVKPPCKAGGYYPLERDGGRVVCFLTLLLETDLSDGCDTPLVLSGSCLNMYLACAVKKTGYLCRQAATKIGNIDV